MMLGSHHLYYQKLSEIGFCSYFWEHNSNFQLLEAMSSGESKYLVETLVLYLLECEPDLTRLFITDWDVHRI